MVNLIIHRFVLIVASFLHAASFPERQIDTFAKRPLASSGADLRLNSS